MALFTAFQRVKYSGFLLFFLVLLFNSLPTNGLVFPHLANSSHAIVFAVASYFLLRAFCTQGASVFRIVLICFCSFLVGVGIELIQPYFGRERSLLDGLYDLIGCTAGGLFFRGLKCPELNRKAKHISLACLLLLSCFLQTIYYVYIVFERQRALPDIMTFEHPWEAELYRVSSSTVLQVVDAPLGWENASKVGKVSFNKGHAYPGFGLPYLPNNWEDYQQLRFDIYSENENNILLNLRVHDRRHNGQYDDRYRYRIAVKPGLNSIQIPLRYVQNGLQGRLMDMAEVEVMMFYMVNVAGPVTLYFDNIGLE